MRGRPKGYKCSEATKAKMRGKRGKRVAKEVEEQPAVEITA